MNQPTALQEVMTGAYGAQETYHEVQTAPPSPPPTKRGFELMFAVVIALIMGLGGGTVLGWILGSAITESTLEESFAEQTQVLEHRLRGDLAERDRYYQRTLRDEAEALRRESDAFRRFAAEHYQSGWMVGWHYVFKGDDATRLYAWCDGLDQHAIRLEHIPAPPDPAVTRAESAGERGD